MGGGKEIRGEVILRGQVGLLILTEEVEACAFLPLGTGHTYLGRHNPGPPDAAVGWP